MWQHCKEEWANIPPKRCDRLINPSKKKLLLLKVVLQALELWGEHSFSHSCRESCENVLTHMTIFMKYIFIF